MAWQQLCVTSPVSVTVFLPERDVSYLQTRIVFGQDSKPLAFPAVVAVANRLLFNCSYRSDSVTRN